MFDERKFITGKIQNTADQEKRLDKNPEDEIKKSAEQPEPPSLEKSSEESLDFAVEKQAKIDQEKLNAIREKISGKKPEQEPQENEGGEKEKIGDVDVKKLTEDLENHKWLGESFTEETKKLREKYITEFGLKPDASGEVIMEAYDAYYLNQIKEKASNVQSPGIIEEFEASSSEKTLSFEKRQDMVNLLLGPMNKLYKKESGEDANMAEYLDDYYKELGVKVDIRYGTIPENQKEDLIDKIADLNKIDQGSLGHIRNNEMPIPFLIISKDGVEKRIPVIGADMDMIMPLRSISQNEKGERISEKTGDFMGIKMVHDSQNSSSIQYVIGQMVHEIDHAVRTSLPNQDVFKGEHKIISEGSAEFAREKFGEAQSQHYPKSGFDYQNRMAWSIAAFSEGSDAGVKGQESLESTYASGNLILKQVEELYGKEVVKSVAYDAQKAIPLEKLAELRKNITDKLKNNQESYKRMILD